MLGVEVVVIDLLQCVGLLNCLPSLLAQISPFLLCIPY